MKLSLRPLTLALLLVSSVAFAAVGKVSLQYQGPLGEGLKKLATQGGVNLVVTGNFQQPVQLMFNDIPADQALKIIAKTNHLSLSREGDVFTLSPVEAGAVAPPVAPAAPKAPAAPGAVKAPPPPSAASSDEDSESSDEEAPDQDEESSSLPVVPPLPPMPDLPPLPHSEHDLSGAGSLTVAEGESVDEAVAYGGTLTVNGTARKAVAFGGNVHLGPHSKILGDVVAFGGKVIREKGSQVDGQVVAFGGKHVGSAIAEGISQSVVHAEDVHEVSHSHPMSAVTWFLMEFVLCFGMGFILLMFFPHPMKQIEGELRRDLLRCGATGVLGSIALALISVLLAITLVGILVIPVLWIAIIAGLCMGYTALANEIGLKLPLLRGKKTQATVLALGTIFLLLVNRIPVAGPTFVGLVGLVGLGAIIRTRFGTRNRSFPEPV